MLVLSRREQETIIINGNIRVTVLSVSPGGGKVKIGVDAPAEVPVHREEVQAKLPAPAPEQ